MTNEKLTVKKIIAIVVLTTLAILAYWVIFIFSLPFTGILSLLFAGGIILLCTASSILNKRRKRGRQE